MTRQSHGFETFFLMTSWGTQYAAQGVDREEVTRRLKGMGLSQMRINQALRAYDEQIARG